MKQPWNFWKGMICDQAFIYLVYRIYGCFLYAYQGQYTMKPSFQGRSNYPLQTVRNAFALISALTAARMYGNIGVKVFYNNVLIDFVGAPLTTNTGKLIWVGLIPAYQSVAYVISAAIPNFFVLSSIFGSLCILQFTYTFPPMLCLGYCMKVSVELPGEGFNPTTRQLVRHDRGLKR